MRRPGQLPRRRGRRSSRIALAVVLLWAGRGRAQDCPGDCDDSGRVTVDELVRGVNIALGRDDVASCALLDGDRDGVVRINELVTAVSGALNGCGTIPATATPPTTTSVTDISTPSPTPSQSPTPVDGTSPIPYIIERDARGLAVHLGERVTASGIVTVNAGQFGNSLLKIYIQRDGVAVKVFHQTSAQVQAFQRGQGLLVSGIVRQIEPVGGDVRNDGTILIDISNGSAQVVSSDNELPTPLPLTVAELNGSGGVAFTGLLVRVSGIHRVDGEWPRLGDRSTQVPVGDDAGGTVAMRFQRPIITTQLADKLASIGTGSFTATAVVVQDDHDPSGDRLGGLQLWVRDANDIDP